jgi:hypothetical protein
LINVAECVICGAAIRNGRSAVVAPFLAKRIWNRSAFAAQLANCESCGLEFFNPRLEPEDEKRLYFRYRTEEYQRMRYATEPWYTEKFNESLSSDAAWQNRKRRLEPIVRELFASKKIETVLDFGGSRGELATLLFPKAKRFVYDISEVETVPGVIPLHSEEECRQHQFDLIVTSNLLEHVGFPRQLMQPITAIASPGTLVFHEVPFEVSGGFMTMAKRMAQLAVLGISRPTVAASLMKPGGLHVMHEHVNYFSPKSLDALMQQTGWKVLASGKYSLGNSSWSPQMLWTLAERGSENKA